MNLKYLIEQKIFKESITNLKIDRSCIINTINAHSYCLAKNDKEFEEALFYSDVLLPDGSSFVLASRVLFNKKIAKLAGYDVHNYLLEIANTSKARVFYLGSNVETLKLIKDKIKFEYPNVVVEGYSPPYCDKFSYDESKEMIKNVNKFRPQILFIGMTAPKQEKWVYNNRDKIDSNIIASVGAVFDFYAGNIKRAPNWMINFGMEWLYRFLNEPRRLWDRYLVNNSKFLYYLAKEKYFNFKLK